MSGLGLCAIVKDEAPYLAEWVAFHRAVGVDHFLIYDNGSTDGTPDRLRALLPPGRLTLVDWPQRPGQVAAYDDALARSAGRLDWLGFIDLDEFLFPVQEPDLPGLLRHYDAYAALCVHWLIYGSNGHRTAPAEGVLAGYTRRAPDDFPPNRHIKTILKPALAVRCLSPHLFEMRGPRVTEDFTPIPAGSNGVLDTPPTVGRVRINHYFTRSHAEWLAKTARGRADTTNPADRRQPADFAAYDRNEVEDRTAERFRGVMRLFMGSGTSRMSFGAGP